VTGPERAISHETLGHGPSDDLEQYNDEQKEAFRSTFASALEQFDGDESRASDVAHAAARGTPGDR
jgi:hypothetical protein